MLQSVHSYNCQDVLRTGRPLRLLESYVGLKASMNCVMKRKGHTALKLGLTYGHDFMKRRDRVRRLVGPSPTCAHHPPPTCRSASGHGRNLPTCRCCALPFRFHRLAPATGHGRNPPIPTCARHPLVQRRRSVGSSPRADARPTGGNPARSPRAGTSDGTGTRPPGHQARHLRLESPRRPWPWLSVGR